MHYSSLAAGQAVGPECHLQRSGRTKKSKILLQLQALPSLCSSFLLGARSLTSLETEKPGWVLGCFPKIRVRMQLAELQESWQGCRAGRQQVNQLSGKKKPLTFNDLFCNPCSQRRPHETHWHSCHGARGVPHVASSPVRGGVGARGSAPASAPWAARQNTPRQADGMGRRRSSREPCYSSYQKDPWENIWCVFKCTHNVYLKYSL